jgi:hypothetical protein
MRDAGFKRPVLAIEVLDHGADFDEIRVAGRGLPVRGHVEGDDLIAAFYQRTDRALHAGDRGLPPMHQKHRLARAEAIERHALAFHLEATGIDRR